MEAKRVDAPAAETVSKKRADSATESAKTDFGRAVRAALLAWAIPGAGHFYVGRRRLAVVFSAIVFASLLIGCSLDGGLHRIVADRPLSILATLGSMGMGLPYFFLRYLFAYSGNIVASGFEYGSAFILTAGLMNLLLTLDSWDIAIGHKDQPTSR